MASILCDSDIEILMLNLIQLCNLPAASDTDSSEPSLEDERQLRHGRLESWLTSYPEQINELLTNPENRDKKTGCMPLHWAAGTGFNEAIILLLDDDRKLLTDPGLSVDQPALHPSTSRTPLHYAARNGRYRNRTSAER